MPVYQFHIVAWALWYFFLSYFVDYSLDPPPSINIKEYFTTILLDQSFRSRLTGFNQFRIRPVIKPLKNWILLNKISGSVTLISGEPEEQDPAGRWAKVFRRLCPEPEAAGQHGCNHRGAEVEDKALETLLFNSLIFAGELS